MLRIRLRRVGKKKQPMYRIVVADSRAPRDGAFVEALGYYHPLDRPTTIKLDEERARHWLDKGAQPSDRVAKILAIQGIQEIPEKLKTRIALGEQRAKDAAAEKAKVKTEAEEAPKAEAAEAPKAEAAEAPKAEATEAPAAEAGGSAAEAAPKAKAEEAPAGEAAAEDQPSDAPEAKAEHKETPAEEAAVEDESSDEPEAKAEEEQPAPAAETKEQASE